MLVKVNYRNRILEYESGTTLQDIANDVKKDFTYDILVATINNKLTSLSTEVVRDCNIDFYDLSTRLGNFVYQKGLGFLFSKAVKDVINCDVKMLSDVSNGIECEILSNDLISEVTVQKIKIRMNDLCDEKLPINKIMVSRKDAIEYFNKINQGDKANSLKYISNSTISLYRLDDTLDYLYGVLPNNTKLINKFNLKFVDDNRVVLLYPYLYDLKKDLRYEKNEKLLETLKSQISYRQSINITNSSELNNAISSGRYGDVIRLSEALQNNKLFEIADKISKNKNIKLVLITGPSSSAKTTVSKKLSLYLTSKNLKPISISIDDFLIDLDKRPVDKDGNPYLETIESIDTKLFNDKISELLSGKEVVMPRFNFNVNKREDSDKKIKMEENGILIIEGIHAFNEKLTQMTAERSKFKLFVCPLAPLNIDNHNLFRSTDNRLIRRIIRDNRLRSLSASETLKMWKKVRISEEENILPYMKDADEIFNTYLTYELGVLKTYVEPLLFAISEDDENYEEAIRLINLFRVILAMPSDSVPDDSIIREFIGGSCFNE